MFYAPPSRSTFPRPRQATLDELQALWNDALHEYQRITGNELHNESIDPDISRRVSESVTTQDLSGTVDQMISRFSSYRQGNYHGLRTVRNTLKAIIPFVRRTTEVGGELAGAISVPGGKSIFVAAGVLLQAAEGVSERFDELLAVFSKLQSFLTRLGVRTRYPFTPESRAIATKILVELLKTFAIATKMMRQSRLVHFGRALIGNDKTIKQAVERVEELTLEELLMTTVESSITLYELTETIHTGFSSLHAQSIRSFSRPSGKPLHALVEEPEDIGTSGLDAEVPLTSTAINASEGGRKSHESSHRANDVPSHEPISQQHATANGQTRFTRSEDTTPVGINLPTGSAASLLPDTPALSGLGSLPPEPQIATINLPSGLRANEDSSPLLGSKVVLKAVRGLIMTKAVNTRLDIALLNLLAATQDVMSLVTQLRQLDDLDDYRSALLKNIMSQAVGSAHLIQHIFAKSRGSSLKNLMFRATKGSHFLDSISAITEALLNLRRELAERGVIETELRLKRMQIQLAMMESRVSVAYGKQSERAFLSHTFNAGLNSGFACLPGTRAQTLSDLSHIADPSSSQVYFLIGAAGTGKSALAHSMGSLVEQAGLLASFCSFDRNAQAERRSSCLFPTIARDIARLNADFDRALQSILRGNASLVDTVDVSIQWKNLIVDPLRYAKVEAPLVIIIDAIDASASSARGRREILDVLSKGIAQLPDNVRILITSRPEREVIRALRHISNGTVDCFDLDARKDEAVFDIQQYLEHELSTNEPEDGKLDPFQYRLLAEGSEGVFQWAVTACDMLLGRPLGVSLPEYFETRIGGALRAGSLTLDDLRRLAALDSLSG